MDSGDPRITIHMVASLDGFVARRDGRVDWLETSDNFADGATMTPEFVEAFLKTIDCYVMGSRTYGTALGFEAQGLGWSYGGKPTYVLTRRSLTKCAIQSCRLRSVTASRSFRGSTGTCRCTSSRQPRTRAAWWRFATRCER